MGSTLIFFRHRTGLKLEPGRAFGLLEAGKTVFPVKSPVAAEIVDANPALAASARAMNADAYAAWLANPELLSPVVRPVWWRPASPSSGRPASR